MSAVNTWPHPVVIIIGATHHVVRGAADASWLLADKWPVMSGTLFMAALQACAAEQAGAVEAGAASAFIAAAHDAGLEVSLANGRLHLAGSTESFSAQSGNLLPAA